MKNSDIIKKGLLLLGSYGIAANLEILLHELCHTGAAWITGGQVYGITINPFSWSYSNSTSPYPIFHVAAGVIGSSIFGFLLFFILLRWTKAWLLPFLLIGPLALINGGSYWVVDTVIRSGGDACSLMQMGISTFAILSTGTILLIGGLFLAFKLVERIGLLNTVFRYRLLICMIGISPHLLGMVVWNFFFNRREITLWLIYAATGIVLIFIFTAIPIWFRSDDTNKQIRVKWAPVIGINCVALSLISGFLIALQFSNAGQPYEVETFSERPEQFPALLVPHPEGTDIAYLISSSKRTNFKMYNLTYTLPVTVSQDEMINFITELQKKYHYILLEYDLLDPNEFADNEWKENIFEYDDTSIRYLSYIQNWIRIDTEIKQARVEVVYKWANNDYGYPSVNHYVTYEPAIPRVYRYVSLHPDQFDPNQVELINKKFSEYQENK